MEPYATVSPLDNALCSDLVDRFCAGDQEAWRTLLGLLWPVIYSFPRRCFSRDPENCQRFLEEMLRRLPYCLRKYDRQLAGFNTWFHRVLRNAFINFLHHREKRPWEAALPVHIESCPRPEDRGDEEEAVEDLFACLKPRERVLLKLRFPDLIQVGELDTLLAVFPGAPAQRTRLLRWIEEAQRQRRRQAQRLTQRIEHVFLERQLLQGRLEQDCPPQDRRRLRLDGLARRKQQLLEKRRSLLATLSYQRIGACTGLTPGTVSSYIYRARRKLRQQYSPEEGAEGRYRHGIPGAGAG